jgi:hypothetical protein
MGKFEPLLSRIPWRVLIAVLGGALVVSGGSRLLSVELTADSEAVIEAIKQGMAMVVVGGVVLIALVIDR